MRINKINNALQIYNNNKGAKKLKENNKVKEDKIDISSVAKDAQFAMSKVKDVEEVRTEKVEKIKEQVKAGTYKIDAGKIAEKILEDLNFDKRI